MLLLLFWLAAAGAASVSLEEAFARDGYDLGARVEFQGMRGALGVSRSERNLMTGRPKKAFYMEGDGYQVGFLTGLLASEDVAQVCGPLLDALPLALVAPGFVLKHNGSEVLREVEQLIKYLLVEAGVDMFAREEARGVFHPEIAREMQGLADGVAAKGVRACSLRKFIALSYSFDLITADAFSGKLWSVLEVEARRRRMSSATVNLLARRETLVGPLPACDFVGVRGSFVSSKGASFFGRSYQFQMADILQDLLSAAVVVPKGASTWKSPIVSIFAPGFVGSFAGVNEHGVAMGVDTIRSPNANQSHVGLNSLLMIRSVLHETSNLGSAVEFVSASQRGAPFLYPICDGAGDCAVLEAGASLPRGVPEDPLQYVSEHLVKKKLVPDSAFLTAHPTATFDRGLYRRYMNYTYDGSFLAFNEALFQEHNYPYNEVAFHNRSVFLFANWTLDNAAAKRLGNDFFMPPLEDEDDMILGTNYAVVPQMRLTMMNPVDDYFAAITAEAPVWRYNKLLSLVMEAKGAIDLQSMVQLMGFLSPDKEPGYWHNYAQPGNPMSAIVEGSISVYDLVKRKVLFKSGYWADGWTQLTLPNYLL